jgi:hypothetical protein
MLTEIDLCHACTYHEIEDGNARTGVVRDRGGGDGGVRALPGERAPNARQGHRELANGGPTLLPHRGVPAVSLCWVVVLIGNRVLPLLVRTPNSVTKSCQIMWPGGRC